LTIFALASTCINYTALQILFLFVFVFVVVFHDAVKEGEEAKRIPDTFTAPTTVCSLGGGSRCIPLR
jgi:uncharacterized SAM-binding protein YcdF (DUF218 family)